MESIDSFSKLFSELRSGSENKSISPENIFQEANLENRKIVNSIISQLMKPSSRIENMESLIALEKLSLQGKSCLILPEHYSNFDLPNLYYLLENSHEKGESIANRIVAIAGLKLNEESDFVRAFTEAYSRLVTYPPRSYEKLRKDAGKNADELNRARAINMAALRKMTRMKHNGNIILVYPSGTRYRPGDPSSKRGLKEMDSYLKVFEYVVFLGMAGNTLRLNTDENEMSRDIPVRDRIVFVASEVCKCSDFRKEVLEKNTQEELDLKQIVADAIMSRLATLHNQALSIYAKE